MTTETVPTTTARPLPYLDDMLPPGIARQVQAEHDAQVGALEVLLAASREDADRNAEVAIRAAATVDALTAELRAARGIVRAARDLVASWEASGFADNVTRVVGPAGHLVRTVQGDR